MTAKFIVITGGPCSGKTTIIDALAGRGHTTVPEAATELIEDPGLEDLRTNPREFQLQVLLRQLENEQRVLETASADSVVFLDRGVGDGFGYLRYHGIEPFEELDEDDVAVVHEESFDFSKLALKPDHSNRPVWVTPDRRIFLESFSPLYRQVST